MNEINDVWIDGVYFDNVDPDKRIDMIASINRKVEELKKNPESRHEFFVSAGISELSPLLIRR
jgi:hypothetical protein